MSVVPASESDVEGCIDSCFDAVRQCERCLDECGGEGYEHDIKTCRDVTDVATLCARLMARDSPLAPSIAEECIEVCETCLEECKSCEAECCQDCVTVLERCIEGCEACC